MQVVTINFASGSSRPYDGRTMNMRIPRLVEFVREKAGFIVCLQELCAVPDDGTGQPTNDPLEALHEAFDATYRFYVERYNAQSNFRLVIMVPKGYESEQTFFRHLYADARDPYRPLSIREADQRPLMGVKIRIPGQLSCVVYTTHVHHDLKIRQHQLAKLASYMEQESSAAGTGYVVLCGDFNFGALLDWHAGVPVQLAPGYLSILSTMTGSAATTYGQRGTFIGFPDDPHQVSSWRDAAYMQEIFFRGFNIKAYRIVRCNPSTRSRFQPSQFWTDHAPLSFEFVSSENESLY